MAVGSASAIRIYLFYTMKLKRYWFVIYPQFRYSQGNFGVTAYSITEARQLLKETLAKLHWPIPENLDNAEVIENIDIRLLDQGHVIPNMGVVTFRGVWFPGLNFT